eukprot:2964132-Rhodomonas_salina.1
MNRSTHLRRDRPQPSLRLRQPFPELSPQLQPRSPPPWYTLHHQRGCLHSDFAPDWRCGTLGVRGMRLRSPAARPPTRPGTSAHPDEYILLGTRTHQDQFRPRYQPRRQISTSVGTLMLN